MLVEKNQEALGPRTELFRLPAVEQRRVNQYGTVLLTQPLSHMILTVWFALLALAIIIFFFEFDMTRKTECHGFLLPGAGVLRVMPAQAGIVVHAKVKEGQQVKAIPLHTTSYGSLNAAGKPFTFNELRARL